MSRACEQELCPSWTGQGCACEVMGIERESDPWCRSEDCQHRHWRSGLMPTHRRGQDCPIIEEGDDGDV